VSHRCIKLGTELAHIIFEMRIDERGYPMELNLFEKEE
jgi:hypothetical protein